MESPSDAELEPAPSPPRHDPVPPSWTTILVGLVLAGLAAAAAAALIAGYLGSRPVDYRPLTHERLADLDRLFAYNQVPDSSIAKGAVEDRQDATARWSFRAYTVNLPPTLSLGGVERLLRRNMAEQNVSVFDEAGHPDGTIVLNLATMGKHFAAVQLTGTPDRSNLIEPARRLARETVEALHGMAPVVERFERGQVEPRENADAIWENVVIDAWLPSAVSAQSVTAQLATTLSRNDVDLAVTAAETPGDTTVTVSYAGLECVRIIFHAPVESAEMPSGDAAADPGSETTPPLPVPDPETLPLESEHLNGDAKVPAVPSTSRTVSGPLRVAIIVDDGGYGGAVSEELLLLDSRLTLSILPWAPHSTDTAQRATELGFEVMLHMPMENSSENNTYPGQLTIGMPAEEVHRLTLDALDDVPGAVGINNHTGSRFTSDTAAMRTFFDGIKARNLFFIDSRTISTSTGFAIAQEMQIPSAARDLFLDHESDKQYIRERFQQLIDLVKEQGTAIGICHFRRNSVDVLREMLPEFEKADIEIVHASELVE